MNHINVAHNILALRKKLGMTQPEFAAEVGVSKTQIVNWEKGKHLPATPVLLIIYEKFHVSPNELLSVNANYDIKGNKIDVEKMKEEYITSIKKLEKLNELYEYRVQELENKLSSFKDSKS